VGGTWNAGNIAGPGLPANVPLTARVIDHVDSLNVQPVSGGSARRYGDSYVIRYTYEHPGDPNIGFPFYWLVYYSKNFGPVLLETYGLDARNAYVMKKRALITVSSR
jgi:hypothetical protein